MKNTEKLEDRVVDFTVVVTKISNSLYKSRTSYYLSDQIIRSSLSASLNYAEARDAEMRSIHEHH